METLCGTSFSKSAVSDVCKDLDTAVKEFQTRPLEGDYPFLTVDATYFKVRENSRIISKAFMIAYGTNAEGHREILGFGVYANESGTTWTDFLLSLKKRVLTGLACFDTSKISAILQINSLLDLHTGRSA